MCYIVIRAELHKSYGFPVADWSSHSLVIPGPRHFGNQSRRRATKMLPGATFHIGPIPEGRRREKNVWVTGRNDIGIRERHFWEWPLLGEGPAYYDYYGLNFVPSACLGSRCVNILVLRNFLFRGIRYSENSHRSSNSLPGKSKNRLPMMFLGLWNIPRQPVLLVLCVNKGVLEKLLGILDSRFRVSPLHVSSRVSTIWVRDINAKTHISPDSLDWAFQTYQLWHLLSFQCRSENSR